jgi:hypothetical protein
MDEGLMTIAQFCDRAGISPSFYHKLRAQGRGPQVLKVGKSVRISLEAETEWRRRFAGEPAWVAVELARLAQDPEWRARATSFLLGWMTAERIRNERSTALHSNR